VFTASYPFYYDRVRVRVRVRVVALIKFHSFYHGATLKVHLPHHTSTAMNGVYGALPSLAANTP
jgi:hypothetical protein